MSSSLPRKLYRERGGLNNLILLAGPAHTAGMVRVALLGENWQDHPELAWQVWPDGLEEMDTSPTTPFFPGKG